MELFDQICSLFCVEQPAGYPAGVVDKAKEAVGGMPVLLEQFYLTCGLSEKLNRLQDTLILPDRYPVFLPWEYLVFFNENQGVCQAGIHMADLALPDPPVYVGYDNERWVKTSDRLSEFLPAMFGYQASICLEHSPEEFYWITREEKARVEALLPGRPEALRSWIDCRITLYGDDYYRAAIMDTGGDCQLNFAANTQSAFEAVREVLAGIGEAM